MQVVVKCQGKVNLTKRDFVGQGGEGSVYAKGATAYKIYTDPTQMIPEGKITELGAITEPNIIKPDKVITNTHGKLLGYTMRYLQDADALCRLFTRTFRDKHNVTPKMMLDLVRKMQAGIAHVHSKNILVVDLNEMNFMVSNTFDDVYFIDVDSYKTAHYPPTALMDNIRDRHSPPNEFTQLTDWFSFAVVSCKMFLGIHPYKGRHSVKGLDDRMQQNISIFNPAVSVPKACYPFNSIPDVYRQWYIAVLEQGKRLTPPQDLHAVIILPTTATPIAVAVALKVQELGHPFDSDIIDCHSSHGCVVIQTQRSVYVDGRIIGNRKGYSAIGFTPERNHAVVATVDNGMLTLYNASVRQSIALSMSAQVVRSDGENIYFKHRDKIMLVNFQEFGGKTVPSARVVANVMEYACQLYDGCAIQNLLGSLYVSILRGTSHYQVRFPNLDGYRIIDARSQKNVLMVAGQKTGRLDRFVFRFDDTFKSYDVRKVEDVTYADLNFAVLDSGVCVHLTHEEKLELFSSKKDSQSLKSVEDPILGGDMTLHRYNGALAFSRGSKLYRLTMK